jgi:hypothetical protein
MILPLPSTGVIFLSYFIQYYNIVSVAERNNTKIQLPSENLTDRTRMIISFIKERQKILRQLTMISNQGASKGNPFIKTTCRKVP